MVLCLSPICKERLFISFLWRRAMCTTSLCCPLCYCEAELILVSLSMISIDTVLLCLQTRDLNPNLWNSLAIEFVLSFICHVWGHKESTSHQNGIAWHSENREIQAGKFPRDFILSKPRLGEPHISNQTSVWKYNTTPPWLIGRCV